MPPRIPPIVLTGFWLASGLSVLGYTVRAYLDTANPDGSGGSGLPSNIPAIAQAGTGEIQSDTNPKKSLVTKAGDALFNLIRGK